MRTVKESNYNDDDFQAEMDLHTMQQAKDLDDDPKRIRNAKQRARLRMQELGELIDDEESENNDAMVLGRGFTRP